MVVKKIISDVIPNIWPLVLFVSIVVVSLRIAYIVNSGKKFILHKEVLSLIFIVYILCLYYVLTYQNTGYGGINYIPFKEMFRYEFGSYKFIKNIVGNIVLFIPFGFFAAYYMNTRRIGPPFIVTLIVSASAEAMQYYIGRVFDIDDIILNVLGGFIGFLIFVALSAIHSKLPKFMRSDNFINFIVIVLLVLTFIYAFKIDIFSYLGG